MSTLTVQFQYGKELPEDVFFRLTMADGRMGVFGEGKISAPDEKGVREAVILFNQQVGLTKTFNLEAHVPGQERRLFKAFYKLDKRAGAYGPAGWSELPPLSTMPPATPAPAASTPEAPSAPLEPTVAPTEPPRSQLLGQPQYYLLAPVKWLRVNRAVHRRYEDEISALEVQFTYAGELPANPVMRIVWKEYTEGNFGETIAIRDEKTDVWTALFINDKLQGNLQAFRLKCYDEKGNELVYADFKVGNGYQIGSKPGGTVPEYRDYGAAHARAMLPTATPEPRETPLPTPTVAATAVPENSPTPAPTEPPYDQARSKRKLLLVDKVANYAYYNTTLRRYEDCDVLSVFFRYKGGLPEGTVLWLVRVDHLLDSYGDAAIVPAELKNAAADLLCAKIVSDRIPLNAIGMRVEAVSPDGEVLFTADFSPDVDGFTAENARKLLASEHPEPSATPELTVVPPQ